MATPGIAANAYAQISRIAGQAGGGAGAGAGIADAIGSPGSKNFGDMLKDAVGSVVETGRKSDSQMQSVAAGKANILDVVTAVSETEVAVDALVAVRDKIVAAYEDIMRMPI
ncbi:MAG: flagellar hook-basal body complex protein FliE [Xanthobacteraceae bacterium]